MHVWSSRTIDATELADLYEWLDRVPLSKVRSNVEKDFADGMLTAEIIKFYFPDLVDLRDYREQQNVQDRIEQWKLLNSKLFRKLGLHVPSHVITQLSIGKTGIAQTLLNNLRTCISLNSVYNHLPAIAVLPEPQPSPVIVGGPSFEDPMWYKYNLRYNFLKEQPPIVFQEQYDYYRQKRQAERALKSSKSRNKLGKSIITSKSFSNPNLRPKQSIFPPLSNNYLIDPRYDLTAAKVEIDDKNKQISDREDEVQYLRGQLKRMEVVLQSKNFKIQELLSQIDKLKPVKKF